uniref:Glutathione synthetase n=1 Tax=Globodera pallida TaxID=36090 RepID=A0A183BS86_GLOPA
MSPSTNTDVVTPNYVADVVEMNENDDNHHQQQLALLVEDALDWAHSLAVQKALNLLYFRVSWDLDFLTEAHRHVIPSDAFTRNMMDILVDVHREGVKQTITLLTQRADYMCHVASTDVGDEAERQQKFELKQIEVNNIAVSMGGLAQHATMLHRRMLQKAGKVPSIGGTVLPENRPIDTLTEGIYIAWSQFVKTFGDPTALLLVVVGEVNQNQFDQRFVEYELELKSTGQMKIVRLTLTQCAESLTLDSNDFTLRLGSRAVAVVYFRAGYAPEDYPTQTEWEARRTIERNAHGLAFKWRIRRRSSTHPVLWNAFSRSQTMLQRWLQFGMIIQDAIANPDRYVLKPQLEGGGGNYFGEEIVTKLRAFTSHERAAHILMEKIRPLVVKNYLVRPFQPSQLVNVVSELGIYGCLVGDGQGLSVCHNHAHGHILRTKSEHVNEGGVAVGAAVIDTPYLF